MSAILDVQNVTRRFAGLIAVNNVSFSLQPKEILGIIGPNGAGKTTLISLISGTVAPTSGDILFEGKSINALQTYQRARIGIGRTFQIMRPFPGLSVLDNVAVGALFGHGGVADAVRDFFIDAGIAPNRILIESDARNTYENAVLTKRLLHPEPGTRWVLVTSAYHMPRSVGVFREAGYDVIPFPVDFRTRGSQDAWRPFDSIAAGLQRTDLAVKEWMGLLAYWVTGRSSALFPSASEKS